MITSTLDGTWRVSCTETTCPRPLMREVLEERHARNLHAKHWREYHVDAPEVDASERTELLAVIRGALGRQGLSDTGAGIVTDAVLAAGYVRPPM